jgi:hypothetical protein
MSDRWSFPNEPGTEPRPDEQEPWEEPIDILADPKLTGVADVDETCLPTSIFAFASAEAQRLQVSPAALAALAIGACSAVLSDDWKVRLKVHDRAWVQHPSIWVAVVAASGRRKTDAFRSATRGIARIEERLRKEYEQALARHREELKAWETLGKGERGPKPEPPAEVRLATDDFTTEVLADLLQGSRKILLRADELATMLGAYERYQSGSINPNRAHALALYDGGPRRIDRVNRGRLFVRNWSAVAMGHIQPAKVQPLVGQLSDDGLLQRFMLVMPPQAEVDDPENDDRAMDWTTIDAFAEVVERLYGLRPSETQGRDGKPEPAVVQAGEDSQAIRRRLFRLIERIEADPVLPPPLKEATSKWRGLLARLALVFHCVEIAEGQRDGGRFDPVDRTTLKAATVAKACNFIMRVVVPSTFRFHAEIGSSGMAEAHGRWIAGYLLSRELQTVTARDIGRAYREVRGNNMAIVAAMALLEHAGWVRPTAGRPLPSAWAINPQVHELFRAQAEAERKRRAAERERLKVSIATLAQ